jgi:hypothetical protein
MSSTDLPPLHPASTAATDPNAPGYPPVDFSNAKAAKDLDAILNLALDELEDDDLDVMAGGVNAEGTGEGRADKDAADSATSHNQKAMQSMFDSLQNPEYGETLQHSLAALSGTQEGVDTLEDYVGTRYKSTSPKPGEEKDVDRTVSKLLDDMGRAGATFEGMESDKVESMGGDIMESMISEFEKSE